MRAPNVDPLVAAVLPEALAFVGMVKNGDGRAVAETLRRVDIAALAVALASMVDDTRTVSQLTSGSVRLVPACDPRLWGPSSRSIHGTRSRYNAGCRGLACVEAERTYQQARWLRRKAQKEGAA